MNPTKLMFPIIAAVALAGCAADPLTKEPALATTIAKGLVGATLRGIDTSRDVKNCTDNAKRDGRNRRTSQAELKNTCQRYVQKREYEREQREAREAREEAEALKQAFDQRKLHEDTTAIVQKQVSQKSWIERHETLPRPVIEVDKALGVD